MGEHTNGLAARIRDFIATQPGPCTAREVLDSMPGTKRNAVSTALNTMMKHGRMIRHAGTYGNVRWSLPGQRFAATKPGEPGPQARNNAGMATLDQAGRQAKAMADARKAARGQPRNSAPETVEEFIARGGRIQQLPQGASANPPRFPIAATPPRRVGAHHPKRGLHA